MYPLYYIYDTPWHAYVFICINAFGELILTEIRRRISQPEVFVFGAETVPPAKRSE